MRLSLALSSFLAAAVAAAGGSATCGSTEYSSEAVAKAADASCQRVKKGTAVGSNSYPHQYKNFEKFSLKGLSGPFYEFPILASGQIYSGGSPGPDRVIITKDCTQAGVLTHQGAKNNAFRECNIKAASPASAVVVDTRLVMAVYLAMMTLAFAA
ncbi:hypothetical protein E4U41_005701 [Claviceps citrina]|nr:hypothetical protein E4U41_005701 [Claviceps citrina]